MHPAPGKQRRCRREGISAIPQVRGRHHLRFHNRKIGAFIDVNHPNVVINVGLPIVGSGIEDIRIPLRKNMSRR